MNNSITENSKKRYLPHDINTRKYAVEMYRNCGDIEYVCRKYHISRISLWRWNKIEEHTPTNTVDFVRRVIEYFGYKPKEIQTDNGIEFTYNKAAIKKEHPLERILKELGIKHHKIQPRTPEHNGKVERSHRKDQERFYYNRVFCSLEDLRNRGKEWRKEYNNFPMRVLKYLTPQEKRAELEVFGMVNYAI